MVNIAKWVVIGLGAIFTALFVKRSAETSIGQASTEIAGAFGTFGQSLGSIGVGLGSLGVGFQKFITSALDPFNLRGLLMGGSGDKRTSDVSTSRVVTIRNGGDAPSGNTGGFNLRQSTTESGGYKGLTGIAAERARSIGF